MTLTWPKKPTGEQPADEVSNVKDQEASDRDKVLAAPSRVLQFSKGTEYINNPNTELVWYSNGQKEVGCQMVQY